MRHSTRDTHSGATCTRVAAARVRVRPALYPPGRRYAARFLRTESAPMTMDGPPGTGLGSACKNESSLESDDQQV
eukprot:916580-Prymnesium_polylepis.1